MFKSTLSDDLIAELMNAGLNKQQATSRTAEVITGLYMDDEGKALVGEAEKQADGIIREAQQQVNGMKKVFRKSIQEFEELREKINTISDTVLAIDEAQKEYGDVADDRAKNTIALYGALIRISERAGANADISVRNAGYVAYAYLGGQARRIYSQNGKKEAGDEDNIDYDDIDYENI